MNKFKCVFFDLDGTLIDTNKLMMEAFKHTLKECLNFTVTEEELKLYVGEPLDKTFARYSPEHVSLMVKTFQNFDKTYHQKMVNFFPGVTQVIEQLYETGVQLGIITSKEEMMAASCSHLDKLKQFFKLIITIDDIDEPKPSPKPILKALEIMGCSRKAALMVGDSPSDIISARKAGVQSVAVGWSMYSPEKLRVEKPDFFISKPVELLALCN